jgi:hypothetical protein
MTGTAQGHLFAPLGKIGKRRYCVTVHLKTRQAQYAGASLPRQIYQHAKHEAISMIVGQLEHGPQFFSDGLGEGPNISPFARLDGSIDHVTDESSFHVVARIPQLNGFRDHRFGVRQTACQQERGAKSLPAAVFEVCP